MEDVKRIMQELYADEKWTSEKTEGGSTLFIAASRQEDGARDPDVYASDKMMAIILAKETGKDVFLLPERSPFRNPDCFFDGGTMELKHVRGGRNKVGKNAMEALKQSPNVFLFIDKNIPVDSCISKIAGSIQICRRSLAEKGKHFLEPPKDARLYLYTEGKLYEGTWADVL